MNIKKVHTAAGYVSMILLIFFALGMVTIITVLDNNSANLNLLTKMFYGEMASCVLLLIWFFTKDN